MSKLNNVFNKHIDVLNGRFGSNSNSLNTDSDHRHDSDSNSLNTDSDHRHDSDSNSLKPNSICIIPCHLNNTVSIWIILSVSQNNVRYYDDHNKIYKTNTLNDWNTWFNWYNKHMDVITIIED